MAKLDNAGYVRFGIPGQADLSGILRTAKGQGLRLEIECKIGTDRLRPEQIAFSEMIQRLGGIFIEARNADVVLEQVKLIHNNN